MNEHYSFKSRRDVLLIFAHHGRPDQELLFVTHRAQSPVFRPSKGRFAVVTGYAAISSIWLSIANDNSDGLSNLLIRILPEYGGMLVSEHAWCHGLDGSLQQADER
jgi:hypothetical protein